VVRGDMALIGPRPEQVDLYDVYEPWQRRRHLVKPGITGWWQVHHRDGVPLHMNVDKDLYYIEHQGLRIDCLILIVTCRIILSALAQPLLSEQGRLPTAGTGQIGTRDETDQGPESVGVSYSAGVD
jgi:lipopolysaccharide/colanic/teichoic acid biosynthesis glycosyltransferase